MTERTPQQQRDNRRAGIGCGTFLLLTGIAFVVGAFSIMKEPEGVPAQARILSCNPTINRQGSSCHGMWRIGEEFHQGSVTGVGPGDVGERIEVRARTDRASAVRGRTMSGIIVLVFAVGLVGFGGAVLRSQLRRRVGLESAHAGDAAV